MRSRLHGHRATLRSTSDPDLSTYKTLEQGLSGWGFWQQNKGQGEKLNPGRTLHSSYQGREKVRAVAAGWNRRKIKRPGLAVVATGLPTIGGRRLV